MSVPSIAALERKTEPWSTYTEGWNDALDLAEQAAEKDLATLRAEVERLRWSAEPAQSDHAKGVVAAYQRVLDLIDKQREVSE